MVYAILRMVDIISISFTIPKKICLSGGGGVWALTTPSPNSPPFSPKPNQPGEKSVSRCPR